MEALGAMEKPTLLQIKDPLLHPIDLKIRW